VVLRRLLRQEYRVRHRYGDRPSTEEYRRRFPGFPETVSDLETATTTEPPSEGPPPAEGYEVLGVVGSGGMGVVDEAREGKLGRVVALKTARSGTEADQRKRFLAEARTTARLDHPGVVPVYELVTPPGGEPFYTMKLVRGRTLEQEVREFHSTARPAGEVAVKQQRLLSAFLAVARTMAFAHSKG